MRYYLHETPGRLRIKIPGLRGKPEATRAVQEELLDLDGIQEVSANAVTGSIVVISDRDVPASQPVLDRLQALGYIDASRGEPAARYNDQALSRAGAAMGKALVGMAVERALGPRGLSFLAALL